jgi:hypothetical protein
MTRTKEEIASRVKKNAPTIWETYPYATVAIVVGSVVLWELGQFIVGWLFGG